MEIKRFIYYMKSIEYARNSFFNVIQPIIGLGLIFYMKVVRYEF